MVVIDYSWRCIDHGGDILDYSWWCIDHGGVWIMVVIY